MHFYHGCIILLVFSFHLYPLAAALGLLSPVWVEWTMYRRKNGDVIPPFEELSKEQMCYWLTRFVLEVRKSV